MRWTLLIVLINTKTRSSPAGFLIDMRMGLILTQGAENLSKIKSVHAFNNVLNGVYILLHKIDCSTSYFCRTTEERKTGSIAGMALWLLSCRLHCTRMCVV